MYRASPARHADVSRCHGGRHHGSRPPPSSHRCIAIDGATPKHRCSPTSTTFHPRRDPMITLSELQAFFDKGWNAHDVDVLMSFMADDCVFETAGGPEAC